MARFFWVWGAVLCDFYSMSQSNNVDNFCASKKVFSWYNAILYKYYCADGLYTLLICQTLIRNSPNKFYNFCFITKEITITMSQANNGQYEEMVQNHNSRIFLQIPAPSLNKSPNRHFWSTFDVLGPLTNIPNNK